MKKYLFFLILPLLLGNFAEAATAQKLYGDYIVTGSLTINGTVPVATGLNPTGSVLLYAGTSAPTGYLFLRGQRVSRSTYSALFTAIGTAYGSGDGSTTFNLPDMRWTFPRGLGDVQTTTGSGTASSSNGTFTAHGFNRTGIKVRLASGTLSGLSASTDYWLIYVDDNTLAFGTTRANALAGTKIAISGSNSAVIQQYESPDASSRVASATGGNTGANVGSYQADDYLSHTHNAVRTMDGVTLNASSNVYNLMSRSDGSGGVNANPMTAASGGNETRPNNISLNYIIKYFVRPTFAGE